jgi:hypothetical protein
VTIQQHAQFRDYEKIVAFLAIGITFSLVLAAAASVYGPEFNAAFSLEAPTPPKFNVVDPRTLAVFDDEILQARAAGPKAGLLRESQ